MTSKTSRLVLFASFFTASLSVVTAEENPQRVPLAQKWNIEGLEREALVYLPTKESPDGAPLVFGFHGHGGGAQQASRSFRLHEIWPEAVVVYMQGVPTPGRLTDPEGKKHGWQSSAGLHEDRDLKFFDAVLKTAKEKQKIDETRIYSTGHSNGGGFTYLLWAERADVFAAMAPSAAAGAKSAPKLTPKPAMHLASPDDPLVKYVWQEQMIAAVKTLNGCTAEGTEWADGCLEYPSATGTPLVVYLHSGGHKYPAEGPALIVKFFKEHAKKGVQ